MQPPDRVPHLLRIPPPLLFVATFFAGLGMQHIVPLPNVSPDIANMMMVIGEGLAVVGGLLALCCVGMFLLSRTTLIPFARAAHLVTYGPYRFSRNPMYVSLVLAYLGAFAIIDQFWPVILLPLPIAFMNWIVIPFEEARMRELFGEAFTEYSANVRRWL